MNLKAKHITSRENYRKVHDTGVLRPMRRRRKFGEDGGGFDIDYVAGDSRAVFFSVADFSAALFEEKHVYGFVFDAALLINQFGGRVGPDLVSDYDDLADAIAKEIDATLPPKPPISDAELQDFAEEMGITEPSLLNRIRTDSTSHYTDLIDAIHHEDAGVPGGEAAIRLFSERVKRLRLEKRKSGTEAHQMLENPTLPLEYLEIVVAREVPISLATHFIEAGTLFYPGR